MGKYICSNLASDKTFVEYHQLKTSANDLPVKKKAVTIKGGSGIANKHFITPRGIVTEVTDSECEFLEKHIAFKRQVSRGFLEVLNKSPSTATAEKISSDLKEDNSAPITPEKLEKAGKKKAKINKK